MARQYLNLAQVYGAVDNAKANQAQLEAQQMQQENMRYQQQRQMNQDALQDRKRGIGANAIKIGEDGKPTIDRQKYIADMLGVDSEEALTRQAQFDKQDADAAKMKRENQKFEIENKSATVKYLKDRLSTVQDDAGFQAFKQEANDLGAQDLVSSAPPTYDPNWQRSQMVNADKFLEQNTPKYERVDLGGKIQIVDVNPVTNPNYAKTNLSKTQSPDSLASNAISIRGQNMTDSRAREKNAIDAASGGYSLKPLPATALKMQQEGLDKLSIASNNNAKLGDVLNKLETGKLNLGLISNLEGAARNYTGASNESSRNLSSFKSTLEKLRNDSLRLNTGVQTDGDAQRAWNELFENINDQELVKQRLGEIQEINKRGADLQKLQVENIRGNYNAPPVDFSKYEVKDAPKAPPPPKSPLATVKSDNDYNKLPKGTRFKAPDGSIRVKK